ncbi:hypothetical protein BGW38_001278 [Lunasporangiospora selenospora]|uniref:DUF7137 domain-containing protein n=1 Tax=Lunasporangiospora selenospora TaxID=979761 RepID=A0A9P6FVU3_9FUNG|nr:hypothetical protein BGW38_001278 [Lunasporangiospora selenospora]
MEEPKESSKNPPMFPIGSDIKFSWSYDNYLLLPPANITIEAYTADNRIFTIGNALPGNTVNYTWTKAAQQNDTQPLLTAMYTLRIFDGAVGRNGRLAEGGYLLTYSGLRFGMYRPEEYIPGDQQHPPVCARCSFASTSGSVEKALPAVLTLMLCLFASLMAFA